MEWGWIVAGILAGGLVGVAGARFLPRAQRRPPADRTPEEWERRLILLTADVKDALEKMEHLNDRIRKRANLKDEPPPADNTRPRFLNGAEILRYAKEKGMIR